MSEPVLTELTTDRGDGGQRLDHVIIRHLSAREAVSRTRVQAWIAAGRVWVEDRPAWRPAQRVMAGWCVRVLADARSEPQPTRPEPMPLTVLFEDDYVLAVDKPAGVVVHPSFRQTAGTLMNGLLHYASAWPDGTRPSLVQRLDKHTSGVLLVAKTGAMHTALSSALRRNEASKVYVALCYGRMRARHRQLRYPLGRDPFDRRRVIVRADGDEAITDIEKMAASRGPAHGLTLVRCRLITGRTHQIRVHLQAEGLPIVGDPVYRAPRSMTLRDLQLDRTVRAFPRQALHAARVVFTHPITQQLVTITSSLPGDMATLLGVVGMTFSSDHLG